jgi:hypothetical protein
MQRGVRICPVERGRLGSGMRNPLEGRHSGAQLCPASEQRFGLAGVPQCVRPSRRWRHPMVCYVNLISDHSELPSHLAKVILVAQRKKQVISAGGICSFCIILCWPRFGTPTTSHQHSVYIVFTIDRNLQFVDRESVAKNKSRVRHEKYGLLGEHLVRS